MSDRCFLFMLSFIVVSNLIDAVATSVWVGTGLAEEVNPLMAWVLEMGAGKFILVKLILINLSVYLLWRFKDRILSKILVVPTFLIYVYVFLIHLYIFSHICGLF